MSCNRRELRRDDQRHLGTRSNYRLVQVAEDIDMYCVVAQR